MQNLQKTLAATAAAIAAHRCQQSGVKPDSFRLLPPLNSFRRPLGREALLSFYFNFSQPFALSLRARLSQDIQVLFLELL